MNRTPAASLVATAVAAAFAAMPAASQATPHYFRDSGGTFSKATRAPEGVKVPVIAWGNFELPDEVPSATVECQSAVGGFIENPKGGGPGGGAIESFNSYRCLDASCLAPDFESVQARNLNGEHETSSEGPFGNGNQVRWPSVLQEKEGSIRTNISNVSILVGCRESSGALIPYTFFDCFTEPARGDELTPLWENGTGIGSKPSKIEFREDSLDCASFKEFIGKSLKVMGYNEQEIIETGQ